MKRLFFGILFLMLSVSLMAQQGKSSRDAVAIGVKGGGNLASFFYFGDLAKDSLGFDTLMMNRVRPMAGLSVEIPMGRNCFIAPEVMLVGRGDSRQFQSTTLGTLMQYQVKTYYLEARVPVALTFQATDWLKPYVFAAPSFGLTLPMGEISMTSTATQAIDSSNMAPFDLGLTVGAGLKFIIDFNTFSLNVKLEAAYSQGLLDTYSAAEHNDQAQAVNVSAYNIKGSRLNRGLEASVTVSLPLKFAPGDACSNWSKDVYPTSRKGHRLSF